LPPTTSSDTVSGLGEIIGTEVRQQVDLRPALSCERWVPSWRIESGRCSILSPQPREQIVERRAFTWRFPELGRR
jgi:hypothetical protein